MARSFLGSFKDKLSRSPSTEKPRSSLQTNSNLRASQPYAVSPPYSGPTDCESATRDIQRSSFIQKNQADKSSIANDLPPSYSAATNGSFSLPSRSASASNSQDTNPYAFLANFDTIFLIDDSLSMSAPGRWREAEKALSAITPICTSHDSDGVDIYFLNHRPVRSSQPNPDGKADGGYYGVTSASTVSDIFATARPSGATPTGQRLRQILKPYMASLERASDPDDVKPINIIVITDGRATDEPEEVLVNAAARLDRIDAAPSQVGVQFFQIGDDPAAAEALRHLDDDLKRRGVRDMVDTCAWSDTKFASRSRWTLTSDVILKVVLGAVLRRLDNQPPGNRMR